MGIKPPKHIEIDQEELEEILAAAKPSLDSSRYKTLKKAIKTLIWLQSVVREKSLSIARLSRMLFGKGTENLKNLKKRAKTKNPSDNADSNDDGPVENPSSNRSERSSDEQIDTDQKNEATSPSNNVPSEESLQNPEKKKGHGRRPLNDYNVSKITYIPHDCLGAGQKCPLCLKGTLYDIDPQTILLIRGQPPLKAEAYSAQGLRCNLCQQIFRAAFPKEIATQPKADMSAKAIICLAKYQLGTPLYRLETWQKIMKLPISDSEMWEWTESVALVLHLVHQALINLAAKGDVIHNDDTTGKILALMEENRQVELAQKGSNNTGKKADITGSINSLHFFKPYILDDTL